MGILLCKGVESLETESKSQEVIRPAQLLHEGQGESQAAGAECIVALLRGLLPHLAPAVSSVCSPRVLPHIHFLLCFSTFIFHFSIPYPCPPFPCFLSHSQCGRKAAQESPLPPALEEKTGPRRQTLPSSCLLETSRLIFPSQEQNTKGCWPRQWISRRSVRSYCSFLSIQCGLLWELLLTFPWPEIPPLLMPESPPLSQSFLCVNHYFLPKVFLCTLKCSWKGKYISFLMPWYKQRMEGKSTKVSKPSSTSHMELL